MAVAGSAWPAINDHTQRSAVLANSSANGMLIRVSAHGTFSGTGSGSASAHPHSSAAISSDGRTGRHIRAQLILSSTRALRV